MSAREVMPMRQVSKLDNLSLRKVHESFSDRRAMNFRLRSEKL